MSDAASSGKVDDKKKKKRKTLPLERRLGRKHLDYSLFFFYYLENSVHGTSALVVADMKKIKEPNEKTGHELVWHSMFFGYNLSSC